MIPGPGWDAFEQLVKADLAHRASDSRLRHLERQPEPTSRLIDLTHNDYLGLRSHAELLQRGRAAIADLPVGAGGSRLLGGEHPIFQQLEDEFARWKQAPSALLCTSGFSANLAIGSSLRGPHFAIFSDAANHASIIDGLRLSRTPKERLTVVPHNDLLAWENTLSKSTADLNLMYTESLFSMDGDCPQLAGMQELAQRYRGVLIIDEAHAIGCMGPDGRGLIAGQGLDHEHIISINPCGKAFAAAGAFICGPSWIRDYVINEARSFIYATAPSPWLAAALRVTLAAMPKLEPQRQHLQQISQQLRDDLIAADFDLDRASAHIVPVVVGSDQLALRYAEFLRAEGIIVRAIRPPTVPVGRARLRLSLHADLTVENLNHMTTALQNARRKLA